MEKIIRLSAPVWAPLGTSVAMLYARAMAASDDAQLMLAYAAGDGKAFEMLYVKYKDSLYRYLLRMVNDVSAAEDLAQEVWAKLIRARKRYRPEAAFSTYLFRIGHNAFIDFTRRSPKRRFEIEFDDEIHGETSDTPLESVSRTELRQRFLGALNALPPEQRDAYLLHEEARLSVACVAEVTGVSPETAKSRIRYAVKKLKNALRETAPGDENDAR